MVLKAHHFTTITDTAKRSILADFKFSKFAFVLGILTKYYFADVKSNIINDEFSLQFNNIFIAYLDARLR